MFMVLFLINFMSVPSLQANMTEMQSSEREINLVANRLNNHPRKTRDYKTPNELFKGVPTQLLRSLRCCA